MNEQRHEENGGGSGVWHKKNKERYKEENANAMYRSHSSESKV